jgi:short subunit dehydrogenase-like uncharacterized protein
LAATGTAGRIALYGATGYTGRLVAAELARREADFVLAGRNGGKLDALAADLGGAETAAVSLDDGDGLRALLDPCAAVISCAGSPFVAHGEPVVAAATESATHYLDTTGEQPFMRTVFSRYGAAAEAAGVAAVTAMGFDYAPGDLIASLTAEGMGAVDDVSLAYAVESFGPSRGTTASAVEMLGTGAVEWRERALVPASPRVSRGRFVFPDPTGLQPMTRYPSGEPITVPRHVDARNVTTSLTALTTVPHPRLAGVAGLARPLSLALRTPARRLIDRAIGALPEGPAPDARKRARWTVVCDVRTGTRRRRGIVSGTDVYGLTAAAVVEGAQRMAAREFDRAGALAPAQAFDPSSFLDALPGVRYEVAER